MEVVLSKVRVLIVDDSVVYRTQIKASLESQSWIEVLGAASNGEIAIKKMNLNMPDLLILDLDMPEMDGIATLTELARRGLKPKILVFSSCSKGDAQEAMEALKLGATDFIAKPDAHQALSEQEAPAERIGRALLPKIRALFPNAASESHSPAGGRQHYPKPAWELLKPQIVLFGSSTGGPTALERIFSELRGPFTCPIVIAQHMPPDFTATFAERLAKLSGVPASEAGNGELLAKNHIYVAPGDFHLRLSGTPERTLVSLDQGPRINSVRPSVDPLFSSAAEVFGDTCLAFVLTGMGADGRDGAVAVKRRNGYVVIQSEASSVVFGMPKAVESAGAYDRVADLSEISALLNAKISTLEPRRANPNERR